LRQAARRDRVGTTPGADFDRRRGRSAIRLSFAGREADIIEAMRRLKTWMRLTSVLSDLRAQSDKTVSRETFWYDWPVENLVAPHT